MPKKREVKGVHTSPEKAGKKNMKADVVKKAAKDLNGTNSKIKNVFEHGISSKYNGQWTEGEFTQSVADFFDYCIEVGMKPTAPLLRLWLGVHRDTVHEWRNHKEKYGYKSDIINKAYDWMECFLQDEIEKYPTGAIFLLKTTHGHIESSKLDITTDGKAITDPNEVDEMVKKLGLDKK